MLVTRPWLAHSTGEREHTLYKWWAARTDNGHPEGTTVDGVVYFDLKEWQKWRAAHSGARREIDGRVWLSRAELARRTGEPVANLQLWWNRRSDNEHPAGRRIGRILYHEEKSWMAWYAEHEKRRRRHLTPVDRRGDPDELVGQAEAARVLGYASSSTIPKYRERGQFAPPDREVPAAGGRVVPQWRRQTLWDYAARRRWSRAPTLTRPTTPEPG